MAASVTRYVAVVGAGGGGDVAAGPTRYGAGVGWQVGGAEQRDRVGGGAGEAVGDVLAVARAVGALLARDGAVVVTGGLGGVMEAACRGAREAGGTTLGILPGIDRHAANAYVDVAVATGMGELRNGLVVRSCDAVVAIAGGHGTLSEIALALKAGKRVVGLGTWAIDGVRAAANPEEAVALALEAAAGG